MCHLRAEIGDGASGIPSGAKAHTHAAAFTARLKPCPFKELAYPFKELAYPFKELAYPFKELK
jgi:hypothetical protein